MTTLNGVYKDAYLTPNYEKPYTKQGPNNSPKFNWYNIVAIIKCYRKHFKAV